MLALSGVLSSSASAQEPVALKKVNNADGTWSYALPEGFDPDEIVHEEIISWQYIGQESFGEGKPSGQPIVRFGPYVEEESNKPRVMIRLDRQGRRWMEVGRDLEASARATKLYDEEFPEPFDVVGESRGLDEQPFIAPDEEWYIQPLAWSHLDCDAAGGPLFENETHLWDGDSRAIVRTWNTTNRQKAAVQIVLNGTDPVCSGALIRQKWVLTAAHCLRDDSVNGQVNSNIVSVQRYDLGHQIDAKFVHLSDSYTGPGGSYGEDWALIQLVNTWVEDGFPAVMTMGLSAATDGTIESLTNFHSLSFPMYGEDAAYAPPPAGPSCGAQHLDSLFHSQEWTTPAVTSKKFRAKMDGTVGQSGSPVYFCPAGDDNVCAGGETAMIFGVHSAWNSVSKRFMGPKVPAFRQDALDIINSNP